MTVFQCDESWSPDFVRFELAFNRFGSSFLDRLGQRLHSAVSSASPPACLPESLRKIPAQSRRGLRWFVDRSSRFQLTVDDHAVIWQIFGIGNAPLTALNMADADSRPNRFWVRRTTGYPSRIKMWFGRENARMSYHTLLSLGSHSIKNRSSPLSTWPGNVP